MTNVIHNYEFLPEPLDTSEKTVSYIVVTPQKKYVRISQAAYILLKGAQEGRSPEAINAELMQKAGKYVPLDEVELYTEQVLQRIKAIETVDAHGLLNSIWLKMRLIPQPWVLAVAKYLSFFFTNSVVIGLLPILFLAFSLGLVETVEALATIPSWAYFPGFLLGLLSVIFHELGHASAAVYYGARPSEIGVGMYFRHPVFYTDVTDIWRLGRWQRIVVNLGGAYFQLIVGAIYAVLLLMTKSPIFEVGLVLIGTSLFLSLNPVFKFDAYWVLSDALVVNNLSQQPTRIFIHYFRRVLGRNSQTLPWPRHTTMVLTIYGLFYLSFWGAVLYQLPHFVVSAIYKAITSWERASLLYQQEPNYFDWQFLTSIEMRAFLQSIAVVGLLGYFLVVRLATPVLRKVLRRPGMHQHG